jgi:ADP-ribose pyrophosphatase YjhB (NUDIX family)
VIRHAISKYIATAMVVSILPATASAQPPCRTAIEAPDFAFAAGCLIKHDGRMLVVRQLSSGKLGVPGGVSKSGESSQCVAHRETWEETGVDVVVHGMLKRFSNGLAVYQCELTDGGAAAGGELPVPATGRNEIAQALWVDPGSIEASQWRFPRQYPVILQLFRR